MIYLILLWFPLAAIGNYVLSVNADEVPNFFKKVLYHVAFWPNDLLTAAKSLYGRHSYRFPKVAALTAWFKR